MSKRSRGPPPKDLWAYSYDVTLPESEEHLQKLQDLLDHEHSQASDGTRTWAGRVVVEPQIIRILIVSDSPAQDREVNRRLEAEMWALRATFELTVPMAVTDDWASSPIIGPFPETGT